MASEAEIEAQELHTEEQEAKEQEEQERKEEFEEPKELSSSMVAEVQWEERGEVLTVWFQSGSEESYRGITKAKYEELLQAASPGQWMWANVLRGGTHY